MIDLPLAAAEDCCQSIVGAPLNDGDAHDLAKGFAALADPSRLRLFSLIASQPEGEVCACALVGPLGRSQPTVSHHLRILFEAGLVTKQRRGNWIWYRAAPNRLEALREALTDRALSSAIAAAPPN